MSGDMMPKDQQEYIDRIQKHCLESTNMTENEAYEFAFRCWQLDYDKKPKKKEFLHFIGRGSCFNTKEGSNSAFFVDGGNLVLIDCGESTFSDLMKFDKAADLFKNITKIHVLITHYHSDHVGSLPSLIYYATYVLHIHIEIYTVDMPRITNILDGGMMYISNKGNDEVARYAHYSIMNIGSFYCIPLNDVNLFIVPTLEDHVENSVGYYIDYFDSKTKERCRIYYSGDTKAVNTVAYMLNCDYYYMDASNKGDDYPHQNVSKIKDACETFNISKDKIRLMHIDDDSVYEKAEEYGFICVRRVIVRKDILNNG